MKERLKFADIDMTDVKSKAILRAAEITINSLVRVALNYMPLSTLLDLMELAIVEDTEKAMRRENPGVEPSLSHLALRSGVDPRTIKRIRKEFAYLKRAPDDTIF